MLVQGVAAGIGLAAESHHHHKEKKAAKIQGQARSPSDAVEPQESELLCHVNEATWDLDDAQYEISGQQDRGGRMQDAEQLADDFPTAQPRPGPATFEPLALPVVLSQRQPKTRTRGFIRAYAPVLYDVGINPAMFLDLSTT